MGGEAMSIMYVNLNDQNPVADYPHWIPETQTATQDFALLVPYGWRICNAIPEAPALYECLVSPHWVQDPLDPFRANAEMAWTLISEREAQEADRARLPTVMPLGIEVPVLVLRDANTGAGWAFIVDDGQLVGGVAQHASPTPDDATLSARRTAAIVALRQYVTDTTAYEDAMGVLLDALAVDNKLNQATRDAAAAAKIKHDKKKASKPNGHV